MRDLLKVYVPIALLIIGGFVFTYRFVDPAPPSVLRMAAGPPDGAYADFAARYAEILARDGITLEVVQTKGSVENLARLTDPTSPVDIAFVQGGTGDPSAQPIVEGIAAVYLEPLFVFVRSDHAIGRLSDLKGKRIAIGGEGSGTRSLALRLLGSAGVVAENSELLVIGGQAAADAMLARAVDVAFFVSGRVTDPIRQLLATPGIALMDFQQADAIAKRERYLTVVTLARGLVDIQRDLPPRPTTLIAPAATLVARDDMHPALVDLLMRAVTEVHRSGQLFEAEGQFPSPRLIDFPLSSEARRIFESGPSFLRNLLPFWAAVMVERLVILLLPLITLMIPLMRIATPTYRWQIRRKIYRHYRALRELEERGRSVVDEVEREEVMRALARLQAEVGAINVPLSYAEDLYHLRLHIDFVRRQF